MGSVGTVHAQAIPTRLRRGPPRPAAPRQFIAFSLAVLAHAALFAALWFFVQPDALPKPRDVFYLTLAPPPPPPPPPPEKIRPLVELPPLPVPELAPPPLPEPVEKPKKAAPPPVPVATSRPAPADNGAPSFTLGGGAGTSGPATSTLGSAAADGIARRAPSDYDAKIKAAVVANKVFPMAAQLKRQECVITYTMTIDRTGQMIAHHIDPCLYPLVNDAAEAAIAKAGAGRFDPPENGAATRTIYGSLPFHLEIQPPPVPARR